jgi:hypothetical protein
MVRLFSFAALLIFSFLKKEPDDRVFTGYFSRHMQIDTSSAHCDSIETGLFYMFQKDSARLAVNNQFLYCLIKCPETYNQSLFNYHSKVKIFYRECTRNDLANVSILNRHKYFNVVNYVITGIELAE